MALETVDARRGCVLLPNGSGGDFQVAAAIDLEENGLRISQSSDFLDWLFVLSQPIKLNDPRMEKNISTAFQGERDRFRELGLAVLVPLVTKRKLVGLLALGPARLGQSYSPVDLELLEAVGNHLSMTVLNATLSQELVINRELEFMHKVSSFVVHDLKNSVSTLSMLLENAANNMKDPQFRQSMLRTIAATVERMNGLMTRIRTMPKDLELNRRAEDINRIIQEVVSKTKIDQLDRIEYQEDLHDIPLTSVDRTYLEKVLTNLLINAVEAMPSGGRMKVTTRIAQNGAGPGGGDQTPAGRWVQIEVADNGQGMTREFIQQRLFRPFQTTKEKGLGIGLYQCREAVEAHGGRIEVTSDERKGTVFTVHLPVAHSTGKETE
jgi:hypothetical protein